MNRQFHEVAGLFPLLSGSAFSDLVVDIRQSGLLEPIVVDSEGRILDGKGAPLLVMPESHDRGPPRRRGGPRHQPSAEEETRARTHATDHLLPSMDLDPRKAQLTRTGHHPQQAGGIEGNPPALVEAIALGAPHRAVRPTTN